MPPNPPWFGSTEIGLTLTTSARKESERIVKVLHDCEEWERKSLLPFAQQQLEKHGEFFPFAASIDTSGAIAMVAVDLDEKQPPSTDVIESLYEVLARSAASGEIRAAGICADVRITPPGSAVQTDAIRTAIEHAQGDPVEVLVPYAKKRIRGFQFGDLFAQAGTARIFLRSA